jgi:undecaprenyl diphosphate synthase
MQNTSYSSVRHIAMIMDGNGRWARQRGLPRLAGHEAGTETVRRVMNYCRDAGIRYLTLYAFSTENWSRPPEEIAGLMSLLGVFIRKHEAELHEKQVRLRVIGNRADISAGLMTEIERIERETAHFERQVIIALSYSGRNELVRAVRRIVEEGLSPEAIDEGVIAAHLDAPDVPDPDLIIRTSGEMRVSNFLLWQCAYSEFFVTPVLWPDFGEAEF